MTIYISLEKYLAQWLIHEFGGLEPIKFFKGSHENDLLKLFLTTMPRCHELAEEHNPNLQTVEIEIPSSPGKIPTYYCYLPCKARKVLCKAIYTRFRVQLWTELHTLKNYDSNITELIYAWMEKHGIVDDGKSWETIRQMYFRQRKKYECEKDLKRSEINILN